MGGSRAREGNAQSSAEGPLHPPGAATGARGLRSLIVLAPHFFLKQRGVTAAVVGKPSTPTPSGGLLVPETLQMAAGEPGGPFALALSARSDALQEFEGGPGQIAMHGRDNLGGVLGQAESHGCMRLDTPGIDGLVARIGPGVPVTIYQG